MACDIGPYFSPTGEILPGYDHPLDLGANVRKKTPRAKSPPANAEAYQARFPQAHRAGDCREARASLGLGTDCGAFALGAQASSGHVWWGLPLSRGACARRDSKHSPARRPETPRPFLLQLREQRRAVAPQLHLDHRDRELPARRRLRFRPTPEPHGIGALARVGAGARNRRVGHLGEKELRDHGATRIRGYGEGLGANAVLPKLLLRKAVDAVITRDLDQGVADRENVLRQLEGIPHAGHEGDGWTILRGGRQLDGKVEQTLKRGVVEDIYGPEAPDSGDELRYVVAREVMRELAPRLNAGESLGHGCGALGGVFHSLAGRHEGRRSVRHAVGARCGQIPLTATRRPS